MMSLHPPAERSRDIYPGLLGLAVMVLSLGLYGATTGGDTRGAALVPGAAVPKIRPIAPRYDMLRGGLAGSGPRTITLDQRGMTIWELALSYRGCPVGKNGAVRLSLYDRPHHLYAPAIVFRRPTGLQEFQVRNGGMYLARIETPNGSCGTWVLADSDTD
jgi:hypothetical protein